MSQKKSVSSRNRGTQRKKKRLECCVKELTSSSNEFAIKAEQTENLTFLAKSNALRRSAN